MEFSKRLRTKFAGMEMRTPVSIAPHGSEGAMALAYPEKVVDRLMEYVEKGASKVSIMYTCPEEMKDYPKGKEGLVRFGRVIDSSPLSKEFRYLCLFTDEDGLMGRKDVGLKVVQMLKKRVPEGVIVEADVVGKGSDFESWAKIAKEFEEAGADCIELDTSCPAFAAHCYPKWAAMIKEGFPNQQVADSEECLGQILEATAKKLTVPFGWKMTPESGWPRFLYLAKQSVEKGASWVTCTNNPLSFTPIDIYNDGRIDNKLVPAGTANCLTGLSGYGRAIGRKMVAAIRTWVPETEIIGITGITKPEYAVEYLMLGASIVELASGLFFYGQDFISQCCRFIERHMEDYGYNSIDDLRGRALVHTEWEASKYDYNYGKYFAKIDKDLCTGCKHCGRHVCFAITHDEANGNKATANPDLCSGCGLCVAICPVDAATLVQREKPKKLDLAKGIIS